MGSILKVRHFIEHDCYAHPILTSQGITWKRVNIYSCARAPPSKREEKKEYKDSVSALIYDSLRDSQVSRNRGQAVDLHEQTGCHVPSDIYRFVFVRGRGRGKRNGQMGYCMVV